MISPYIAEFVGTSILLLLGSGIVANVNLSKTKGSKETPLITITTAWGFLEPFGLLLSSIVSLRGIGNWNTMLQ